MIYLRTTYIQAQHNLHRKLTFIHEEHDKKAIYLSVTRTHNTHFVRHTKRHPHTNTHDTQNKTLYNIIIVYAL